EVLVTLAKLLAPIIPFTAETMYQNLIVSVFPDAPESVHLCDWPTAVESLIDRKLIEETDAVMKVVRLGRSARNAGGMKVRQPLATLTVKPTSKEEKEAVLRNERLILDELNMKGLSLISDASGLVKHTLKPNFSLLGPKYGKLLPKIQGALSKGDQDVLSAKIIAGENAEIEVEGQTISLEPSEVMIEAITPENISCAEETGTVVAVDTTLTDELIQEGLIRDLVRGIQNMRKDSDFNVDDHISIEYYAEGLLAKAVESWADYIRQETLANSLKVAADKESLTAVKIAGEEIGLKLAKA
ncbi:MAG TPA: DUF5915 domain-containing protein, partial [Armatimonadota bacterium]